MNEFGDVVIGATGTSTTEFASSYALVRRAGSGVFDPLQLRAGVANYVNLDSLNRNRWGDYSATDPSIPPTPASSGQPKSTSAVRTPGRRK